MFQDSSTPSSSRIAFNIFGIAGLAIKIRKRDFVMALFKNYRLFLT